MTIVGKALNRVRDAVLDMYTDCEDDYEWDIFIDKEQIEKFTGKQRVKCPYCEKIVSEICKFDENNELKSVKYRTSVDVGRFVYIPEYNAIAWKCRCVECNSEHGFKDFREYMTKGGFYVCINLDDVDGDIFLLRGDEVDSNDIFYLAEYINHYKPPYIFFKHDIDSTVQDIIRKTKNK